MRPLRFLPTNIHFMFPRVVFSSRIGFSSLTPRDLNRDSLSLCLVSRMSIDLELTNPKDSPSNHGQSV